MKKLARKRFLLSVCLDKTNLTFYSFLLISKKKVWLSKNMHKMLWSFCCACFSYIVVCSVGRLKWEEKRVNQVMLFNTIFQFCFKPSFARSHLHIYPLVSCFWKSLPCLLQPRKGVSRANLLLMLGPLKISQFEKWNILFTFIYSF